MCLGLACSLILPKNIRVYSESQYRDEFIAWTYKYNKMYTSDEFFMRYDIFKNNMDYVSRWNAQGSKTVRMYLIMKVLRS